MTAALHPWETLPQGAAARQAEACQKALPGLQTARLTLRAPRLSDFPLFAALFTGAEARFLGGPFSRDEAMAVFTSMAGGWLLRGHGLCAVETRGAAPELLGFVALDHETGDPDVELGYFLAPSARGQGFAREAAQALRDFARDGLGLARLVSYVDPENQASRRLAESLGATLAPETFDGALVYHHDLTKGPGQ